MSLTHTILLTLGNTVICLVLPKLISLIFTIKDNSKTLAKTSTIDLKKQPETI